MKRKNIYIILFLLSLFVIAMCFSSNSFMEGIGPTAGNPVCAANNQCPSSKPFCVGHIPGKKWGSCSASTPGPTTAPPKTTPPVIECNYNGGCPASRPNCIGYRPNEKWGNCSASKPAPTKAGDEPESTQGINACGGDGNCPSYLPKCVGYVQDQSWGRCVAPPSKPKTNK